MLNIKQLQHNLCYSICPKLVGCLSVSTTSCNDITNSDLNIFDPKSDSLTSSSLISFQIDIVMYSSQ